MFTLLRVESRPAQHTAAILVGFFVNVFLLVVVGELGPKALAIRKTVSRQLNHPFARGTG